MEHQLQTLKEIIHNEDVSFDNRYEQLKKFIKLFYKLTGRKTFYHNRTKKWN